MKRSDPPANLTEKAAQDLEDILNRSNREFGSDHANDLELRIFAQCNDIASGLNHGHLRPDVPRRRTTRYITVHPFVIAYNPKTKRVIRIIDGRRDFTKLFR